MLACHGARSHRSRSGADQVLVNCRSEWVVCMGCECPECPMLLVVAGATVAVPVFVYLLCASLSEERLSLCTHA